MKSLLHNDAAAIIARALLGAVFVIASADKITAPEAFAVSIANYRIAPEAVNLFFATILPWVELLCGLAILFGILRGGASLLLSSLLVVFTAAIVSALIRGLDISCGCFTQDPTAGRIGWMKVAENIGLFALSTFLFFSTSVKFTLEAYLAKRMHAGSNPS
jgi:uncharacterized membrane protein YphA (DoxX/SURF4 family)